MQGNARLTLLHLRGEGAGEFVHQPWRVVGGGLLWGWEGRDSRVGPSSLGQQPSLVLQKGPELRRFRHGQLEVETVWVTGAGGGMDDDCCTCFLRESQLISSTWNIQQEFLYHLLTPSLLPNNFLLMLSFHISPNP